tara:strand:- start:3554 stop:3886 length:333 start_codon:yes stop_codon:yes gene_type:complete
MKVTLIVVPPGGGEADYEVDFEMPAIPRNGDYIVLNRSDDTYKDKPGMAYFIVRRTWWSLEYDDRGGRTNVVAVEVEFAKGPVQSEPHTSSIKMYESRGKKARELENTAY